VRREDRVAGPDIQRKERGNSGGRRLSAGVSSNSVELRLQFTRRLEKVRIEKKDRPGQTPYPGKRSTIGTTSPRLDVGVVL